MYLKIVSPYAEYTLIIWNLRTLAKNAEQHQGFLSHYEAFLFFFLIHALKKFLKKKISEFLLTERGHEAEEHLLKLTLNGILP